MVSGLRIPCLALRNAGAAEQAAAQLCSMCWRKSGSSLSHPGAEAEGSSWNGDPACTACVAIIHWVCSVDLVNQKEFPFRRGSCHLFINVATLNSFLWYCILLEEFPTVISCWRGRKEKFSNLPENTAVSASREGETFRIQWHTLTNTAQKCYQPAFRSTGLGELLVSASVSGRSQGEIKNNLQGFRIIYDGSCNAVTSKMLNVSHSREVLSGEYLSSWSISF